MKTLRQLQTAINDYVEKHPENLDRGVLVSCSEGFSDEEWCYLGVYVESITENVWQTGG